VRPERPHLAKMSGMKLSLLIIPLLWATTGISPATAQTRTATATERAACEDKIQQKIDAIDSKMRAEYTGPEGERLKEKRRKLEAERYNCRKKK
jgi:uncharacterized protein